tara:strand:- start:945 stop:1508 length:564 start_codon:yes stop_codon:yes gene_type:complete
MKKSEFKEYLKTEILKMGEATQKDVDLQADLNAELEKTKELMGSMMEGKGSTVTLDRKDMSKLHSDGEIEVDDHTIKFDMKEGRMKKSQFKEYLKQEILAEINEQEEDIELGDLEGEEEITATVAEPQQDKALELDDIGDTLVQLARRAKDVEERELANQILNSAKFAKKTEFKKVEKDAGIGEEGE